MNALKLASTLWARDLLIGFVAFAGWPRWAWASRVVDWCEVRAEGLQERREVRA